MILPPINYTGSKRRLMPQLADILYQGCETFYDYFGGSACVSLNNIQYANKIVYNDRDKNLVNLMKYLHTTDTNLIIKEIRDVIAKHSLGKGNKEEFWKYREYFNQDTFGNTAAEFMALISHSFSSSIRYSTDGKRITSSSGDNDAFFRDTHEKKLIDCANEFKKVPMEFTSLDLFDIDFDKPQKYDMVYLDPPYLASGESMYSKFWGDKQENYLYSKLDYLTSRGVDFALSNVLYSKGFVNPILAEWSKKYNIHDLVINYQNSSHQVYEGKTLPTREVLITNF